jgi:V-type H+-transporting ATPase subunit A
VTGGDVYGTVQELGFTHRLMVPPNIMGVLKTIVSEGEYTVDETLLEIEFAGEIKKFSMTHRWPIRTPRPIVERLPFVRPLLFGVRVTDVLFPCAQGGTCALPGASGVGKTAIIWPIFKYSNCDFVIHIRCGERMNEVVEFAMEFKMVDSSVRSTLIANTSSMPQASREASIYTGVTLGEYFRDMGYNVAVVADSLSRWGEAMRDIGSLIGEPMVNSGFPASLSTKLNSFFGRAGRVTCAGSPEREGSVAIIGTVSPPGGDFNDAITSSILATVQTFWALDIALQRKKHFPSVNWLFSLTRPSTQDDIFPYFESIEPNFRELRRSCLEILQREDELQNSVAQFGIDHLPATDQALLLVAKWIREDFLQQNMFSSYDKFAPLKKSIAMLKVFVYLHKKCQEEAKKARRPWKETKAILNERVTGWGDGKGVFTMKFQEKEEDAIEHCNAQLDRIDAEFKALEIEQE